ncbi:hypothetical protein NXS19_001338 [Fusarium pseudograminearum]|nr:hypothetical protein NXS19_001338 [Fusarium pseudograminearum]
MTMRAATQRSPLLEAQFRNCLTYHVSFPLQRIPKCPSEAENFEQATRTMMLKYVYSTLTRNTRRAMPRHLSPSL